jgi:hypothetical protein
MHLPCEPIPARCCKETGFVEGTVTATDLRIGHLLGTRSALSLVASTFGVLAGTGGIRHAIGEILQGDAAPTGLVIDSWTKGPIATNMDGEPALTVIPNVLVTGIIGLLISSAALVWAARYVERPKGGLILILFSIAMFLAGGGFGPPIVGLLAGIAGTGINGSLTWWRAHLGVTPARILGKLFPLVFAVAAANGVFLFLVSLILVFVFDVNQADMFLASFYLAVLSLLLVTLMATANDLDAVKQSHAAR